MLSMFGLAAFQVMKTFKPRSASPIVEIEEPVRREKGTGLTSAERGQKMRDERRAAGRCIRCNEKKSQARLKKATCERCSIDQSLRDEARRGTTKRKKDREKKRGLIAGRKCVRCRAKLSATHKTIHCDPCREITRKQERDRYAKKKAKKGNNGNGAVCVDGGGTPDGGDNRAAGGCGSPGSGVRNNPE